MDREADQEVIGRSLGVFGKDIKVAVPIKHAAVGQFEFGLEEPAPAVFLDQARVRKFRLGVFVERPQIRVRGRGVEVKVALLDVLAVVTLRAGQPKEALL
jgi:hypothetical protein